MGKINLSLLLRKPSERYEVTGVKFPQPHQLQLPRSACLAAPDQSNNLNPQTRTNDILPARPSKSRVQALLLDIVGILGHIVAIGALAVLVHLAANGNSGGSMIDERGAVACFAVGLAA